MSIRVLRFLLTSCTARVLATIVVVAAAVILAPHRDAARREALDTMGKRLVQRRAALGEVGEAAPGIDFYYRTRGYGSGAINVDLARMRAWEAFVAGEGTAFDKMAASGRMHADPAVWRFLGPKRIAGRIRALALHPTDPRIMYAGSASGGVFKSVDAGRSWFPVGDALPVMPVGAVAVHPGFPEDVWIGTGEPTIPLSRASSAPSYSGVGLLHSTDAGATWERLSWTGRPSAISRIALHPASRDTLLVGTREGVARSTDGGVRWTPNVLPGVISDIARKPGSDATVYAAIGNEDGSPANGIYRSDAGGERFTWHRMSENFPPGDSIGRIVIATTPADPERIVALVATPFFVGGVFRNDFFAIMRSTDGGAHWERFPAALPATMALSQAHYDLCIAIAPDDPRLVYAGAIELYASADGGATFSPLTFAGQVVHVDQHVIVPGDAGRVLAGNDGGVFSSTDRGLSWSPLNEGLATTQFYTVAFDRQNPRRIFGGTQDNGILRYLEAQDSTWSIIRGDIDGGCVAADGNLLYTLSTLIRYPFRSTDGGQVWKDIGQGLGSQFSDNWLQPLLLHPTDRTRLYTATSAVFSALDVHNPAVNPQWRQISGDLTRGTVAESVISTLAIAESDKSCMYVGSGDGRLHVTRTLLDPQPLWADITQGLPNRWITRVAVAPTDASTAYVTVSGYGSGHVFRTNDAGASWIDISSNLPDIPVNAIALYRGRPGLLFLATDLGVWATKDDGGSWFRYGMDLPNVVVYDIAITNTNQLLVATHGRGMWSSDATLGIGGTTTASDFTVQPVHALGGASVPALDVRTPAAGTLTCTVFDATGRRLNARTWDCAAGRHRLTLDGMIRQSGVWLVVVESRRGIRVEQRSTRLLVVR